MASRFKALFFDLDGTLVDIHGPLYSAAKGALEQLRHGDPLTPERYRKLIEQDGIFLGVPEHLKREYAKLAFAYFTTENDKAERLEVLPHVAETLSELKRRGYTTGVVTSRPGDSRRLVEKLAMVGLASHLDHVITQPIPSLRALDKTERLRYAATRAGAVPRACMYIGDEPRDMMAAANAGFGARVGVATGVAGYDVLANYQEHKPDFVMHSLGELVGLLERFDH